MSPLRTADDAEPCLILRPCSFDTFMAGPVGEITFNQIRPDDVHGTNITLNSKNWKCSNDRPAATPIPDFNFRAMLRSAPPPPPLRGGSPPPLSRWRIR